MGRHLPAAHRAQAAPHRHTFSAVSPTPSAPHYRELCEVSRTPRASPAVRLLSSRVLCEAPHRRITPEIQERCAHPHASAYPAKRSRLQPLHAPHLAPAEVFQPPLRATSTHRLRPTAPETTSQERASAPTRAKNLHPSRSRQRSPRQVEPFRRPTTIPLDPSPAGGKRHVSFLFRENMEIPSFPEPKTPCKNQLPQIGPGCRT